MLHFMSKLGKNKNGLLNSIWGRVNKVAFFICLAISIMLIVIAFFVPPTAVIDGSVLTATGEIFAFCALLTVMDAVERGHDIKMQKGETSISINKDTDIED